MDTQQGRILINELRTLNKSLGSMTRILACIDSHLKKLSDVAALMNDNGIEATVSGEVTTIEEKKGEESNDISEEA